MPRQQTETDDDNRFLEEVIAGDRIILEAAVEWIGDNLVPPQVFDEAILNEWAETNGYTKD